MARNQLPMMSTGSGVLGKLVGALITIGFLAFVVKDPASAAQLVNGLVGLLGKVVDGIASFANHLHG